MLHVTLPPPDPETWQSTEPVDRWTANTRGFEHVPDTVPDFDALTEKAQQAQVAAVSADTEPTHDDLDHGTGLDPEERFWLQFDAWQQQSAG